jgi:hypothetical protein
LVGGYFWNDAKSSTPVGGQFIARAAPSVGEIQLAILVLFAELETTLARKNIEEDVLQCAAQ